MKIDPIHNTQVWQNLTWHKNTRKANTLVYDLPDYDTPNKLASQQTLKSIIEHYPAPYYLCLTGGVDSQAMLYVWHKTVGTHPDVIPVSFLYNERCNEYDQVGITDICTKYGYHRQIRSFDLMEFIDSGECTQYQIKHFTQSPQMAAWIKMTESLQSGTVIMSGELTYDRTPTAMIPNHFGVREYAQNLNLSDSDLCYIPFFFEHDYDIATSHWHQIKKIKYQASDYIDQLDRGHFKSMYLNKKVKKYHTVGFPVIPQNLGPSGRCSGFEKFKDLYDETHEYDRDVRMKSVSSYTEPSDRKFDVNLRLNLLDTIKYSHIFLHHIKRSDSN